MKNILSPKTVFFYVFLSNILSEKKIYSLRTRIVNMRKENIYKGDILSKFILT